MNYEAVRSEIKKLLDSPESKKYEDGSYGPLLVRLAWHAAGTYNTFDNTGGSHGATMRFAPESAWGANAGLGIARDILEPIKTKFGSKLSYADLWTLAGIVAIEHMGGPKITWRPGRTDDKDGKRIVEDGRLPDASRAEDHVRAIFYRMGFSDREIVALNGAHCVGRCHRDRSGYDGPWSHNPTRFSNIFFINLLNKKWTKRNWDGPLQYEDESKKLMMLPADLCMRDDKLFRKYSELYAKDRDAFFDDFAAAFGKLMELGCPTLKSRL